MANIITSADAPEQARFCYTGRMNKFVIGIDEAGRGPLAGPVAVGACIASPRIIRKFRDIKESKQLAPSLREAWYERLRAASGEELAFAVSFVSARVIDKKGIAAAIRLALRHALARLRADPKRCAVLLDGGLKAPPEYQKQQTIIRGDATETIIAMASVVAKVERDRLMRRLHKKHPRYGWDRNAGYGTKAHFAAIERYGRSSEHRRTFTRGLRVRAT